MQFKFESSLLDASCLMLLCCAASAQTAPPEYNRSIGDIEVSPTAGAPDSFFDITIVLDVSRDSSTPTLFDLSTEVIVMVDGTGVASSFVNVAFDPPYDGCGPLGCANNWGCASLNADGLLLLGYCKTFTQGNDDVVFCQCGGSVDVPFTMVHATPGDVIEVILKPVPGALPELPGFEEDEERLRVPLEGTRPFCAGDGTAADCPCDNFGATGQGCENSTSAGGELFATGSVEIASDDLVFHAVGLPANQPALLFYGTAWVEGGDGSPFGDGLRCVGGQVVRLGVDTADAEGNAIWGPGLAALKGWDESDQFAFQGWYRDPSGPCQTGFNLTNALDVVFEP